MTSPSSECTVAQFREQQGLEVNINNVLVEFGDPTIKEIRDVILMDKVIMTITIPCIMLGHLFDCRKLRCYSLVQLLAPTQVHIKKTIGYLCWVPLIKN